MATIGYFDEQTHDTNDLFFKILGNSPGLNGFKVNGFSTGYVEAKALPRTEIEDVLHSVLGCFETCSNFKQELFKVYNCSETTELKGIRITHEDVTLTITPNTTDIYMLLAEYWKERYYYRVRYDSGMPNFQQLDNNAKS